MDNNKFTLYKENALSFALVEKYKSNVKIPKVKVCLQFFFFIWWGRWWLSYFNTCQSWNSSQRLRLPCLRSLYTTILFIRNYFYNRYRLDHFLSLSVLEAFFISHHLACLEDETYKAKCDGRTGIKTGFTSQCHGSKTLCWKKITTVIFEKQVLTSKALTGVYTMLSVWLVGKNCSYPALVLLQMILLLFIHWLTFFLVQLKCSWNKSSWGTCASVLPGRKSSLNGSVETIPKNVQTWLNLAGFDLLSSAGCSTA